MISKARQGLDALLARHPDAEVAIATAYPMTWWGRSHPPERIGAWTSPHYAATVASGLTPWLSVDLTNGTGKLMRFAIWKVTGNVYELDERGAAGEDPIIEVTPL